MTKLTAELLAPACRIFLSLAYPEGPGTIPASRRAYLDLSRNQPLAPLLAAPIGQVLKTPEGELRGYALRLGSAHFPHLKLQVVCCGEGGAWVVAVDTHDALPVAADHPDRARWSQLQGANRRCKEAIERAWEEAGLLTFHGLLRRGTSGGH
jgi:hypothetical protein